MQQPVLTAGIRCASVAEELESCRPFINPAFYRDLNNTVRQLRYAADRLGAVPKAGGSAVGDSPVSAGRRNNV